MSRKLKDATHSQIKHRSLSVKRAGPKTAKPEENEPPPEPHCGWQDETVRRLRLEETQDNEIIFNPRPSKARATPVIVNAVVK